MRQETPRSEAEQRTTTATTMAMPTDVVGMMCSDAQWPEKADQTRAFTMLALSRMAKCRGMTDPQNARVKHMLCEAARHVDTIDADMRGVTFMMVLNCDEWLRDFVCAQHHENRGSAYGPLPSAGAREFFVELAVACEEYADRVKDDIQFMATVRESHQRAVSAQSQAQTTTTTTVAAMTPGAMHYRSTSPDCA